MSSGDVLFLLRGILILGLSFIVVNALIDIWKSHKKLNAATHIVFYDVTDTKKGKG